jgi:hypothetical protein
LGLRAAQKAGADLRSVGTKKQRRRNSARIRNAACSNDRHMCGIDNSGQQSEQADLLPLGRSGVETTTMATSSRALSHDDVRAGSFSGTSLRCRRDIGKPDDALCLEPGDELRRVKAHNG